MKIALVDDKDYWIEQIKNSIPKSFDYDFLYYSSYKDAVNKSFDILFLDYYLDKDWLTWKDVIWIMDANIIIWFSSVQSCNEKLIKEWADFWIQKINWKNNYELNELMKNIL